MSDYLHRVFTLFKQLLLLLVLFFLSRLFFFFYNYFIFSDITFSNLFQLFIAGIRFDLPVIIYFNLIYSIIFIFPIGNPLQNKGVKIFLKIYFVAVNSLLLLVDMSDAIFFHFTQKRSTADIIRFIFLSDDVKVLLPKFIVSYWFVPLFWILSVIILWKIYSIITPKGKSPKIISVKSTIQQSIVFIFILLLSIIGGRGGLQLKPIAIIDASKYATAENIPLVLNTPFSIMTTYGHKGIKIRTYFSQKEAQQIYPVIHRYNNKQIVKKKNIVVLLLESFSKEYVGYFNGYKGYTPFLDSLIPHALVFNHAYSNGLRSIDAIPAIVSGIPALMHEALITSTYSANKVTSLPELLKAQGYYTAFFHGGTNGTMNFDGFASHAGFDDYFGRYEYNNDKDYDGTWGIYDEPFLQYVAQKLNNAKKPFFAFEFTLSSHYPYKLPDQYKNRFKEGPLQIHKVISYADYSLKRFFETASKMPWYNNTLFILCADHPAQSVVPNDNGTYDDQFEKLPLDKMAFYNNLTGKYAIPIILFDPGNPKLQGVSNRTVQQTDITPTIINYLDINTPFVAFGQSVFDSTAPQAAFQFYNGIYQITQYPYSLEFDGEKALGLYDNNSDVKHTNNLVLKESATTQKLDSIMKAILQQYSTRLFNNRLTDTLE